jgi:hypothetical protein
MRGANQLVLWVLYNEKIIRQHIILHVTSYRHDTTNIGIQFGFRWQ